jgi:hypothetical protein
VTILASKPQAAGPGGLIDGIVLASGSCSATLTLDRNDRCFFDHPLDHVPAMALVSGLLALVRASGTGDLDQAGLQLGLSVTLPAFCELGSEVRLETAAPIAGGMYARQDGAVTVRARQDGQVVCDGEVAVRPARRAGAGFPHAPAGRTVEKALVHRQRPENVLIHGLATDDGRCAVTVRRPAAGHVLAIGPGQTVAPEVLIDAARQFGTLICHEQHHAPLDTQFILLGIEADVPCGLRGAVQLSWQRTPAPRGRRATIEFGVVAGDPDGQPCGRIAFTFFCATPATYRRLRDRKTTA